MAFNSGKFGIEYSSGPRRDDESHAMRYAVLALFALAAVSFISARGCIRRNKVATIGKPVAPRASIVSRVVSKSEPEIVRERPPFFGIGGSSAADEHENKEERCPEQSASMQPVPTDKRNGNLTALQEMGATRSSAVRALLDRLAVAERSGNHQLAIDALEKLRARPDAADLDDRLARRLGTLNMALLLSQTATTWTSTDRLRSGESLQRLAREHGTTVSAILRLNKISDPRRVPAGRPLRVMEHPRLALVIHRRARIADLSLNGKFFKRYDVSSMSATLSSGAFSITRAEGIRRLLTKLGVKFTASSVGELEMLMPPGSSLLISDP